MSKKITKKVHGVVIDFNVDTAPSDNAVHVHVSVSSNSLEEFNKFTDQSKILEWVATGIAIETHPDAHLMFTQINMGTEWQGQFDF